MEGFMMIENLNYPISLRRLQFLKRETNVIFQKAVLVLVLDLQLYCLPGLLQYLSAPQRKASSTFRGTNKSLCF